MNLPLPLCLIALAALSASVQAAQTPPFDVLITRARIVDGSGNSWYRGDIGIRSGRIAAIGSLSAAPASRRIDAADRVVTPGFIDLMGQSTAIYLHDRVAAECRLRQGITTHVSGEGWSHAPQNERTQATALEIDGRKLRWRSFAEYFAILEEFRLPINVVHNVGASQVRSVVMGSHDRVPTASELAAMERLVDEAMRDGAGGLSSALIYPPGTYAKTEELIALARVTARHGGFYSTHMRNESSELLRSIDEAVRIGEEAGLPVHIYHLKAAGTENWPLMRKAIERIDAARRRGVDVTADIYPYIRNGIGLTAFVPPWHYAEGAAAFFPRLKDPILRQQIRRELEAPPADWDNWYRHVGQNWDKVLITGAGSHPDKKIVGLSILGAAKHSGKDIWDLFFELLPKGISLAPESMNEEQKHLALRTPWVMIETDTAPVNPANVTSTHPRAFGAFPRVLAKYVREENILPLEDAIRRMTSLTANRLGLHDRGRIGVGLAADLVIFDPEKIQDRATFAEPLQYAEGVDYLLINGTLVIDDRRITGALPGKVLRLGHAAKEN